MPLITMWDSRKRVRDSGLGCSNSKLMTGVNYSVILVIDFKKSNQVSYDNSKDAGP